MTRTARPIRRRVRQVADRRPVELAAAAASAIDRASRLARGIGTRRFSAAASVTESAQQRSDPAARCSRRSTSRRRTSVMSRGSRARADGVPHSEARSAVATDFDGRLLLTKASKYRPPQNGGHIAVMGGHEPGSFWSMLLQIGQLASRRGHSRGATRGRVRLANAGDRPSSTSVPALQSTTSRRRCSRLNAAELVKLLDEAGIRRAVVLSLGYQYGNPNKPVVPDEYAAVKAENDCDR